MRWPWLSPVQKINDKSFGHLPRDISPVMMLFACNPSGGTRDSFPIRMLSRHKTNEMTNF